MKEISLNILDIVENSVKAGASLTEIIIDESESELILTIKDNGVGMSKEIVSAVTNPFYTTRKTRSVGLGIPLLKLAAEQTGGEVSISSKTADEHPEEHGTTVVARFIKSHIDFTPLGDVISTLKTLVQGHPDRDFLYIHNLNSGRVELDTREIREVLEGVPLDCIEVISWIGDNLKEQYGEV
ncbi:MAG: ATP-binding protein [Clostridia bacterium]|nr:ATP-binding protein [Clostridia bacterium]